ncbi:MAG: hypothetical protein ACE5KM_17140 [Planctomycetaceae bacterium]
MTSSSSSRREFLADVGGGMLIGTLGAALTADLGLAAAFDVRDDGRLTFGKLEPLVSFMQETSLNKLQPRVAEKIAKGTDLKTLLAAAGLANARTFGGQDYIGFHTMMALTPALHMSGQLPTKRKSLPVLKVLYRNTQRIQKYGGKKSEKLKQLAARKRPSGNPGKILRDATRTANFDKADGTFAAFADASPADAFNQVQWCVHEAADVHRVVLAWRAWSMIDVVGKQHAHTLLRQSVRYAVNMEQARLRRKRPTPEIRSLLPKLLDENRFPGRKLGKRRPDAKWLQEFASTVFKSGRREAAEAAAAALADGISPAAVGNALAIAANMLLLHDPGRSRPGGEDKPIGSVHGASVGVHASDSANAWRHISQVTNERNRVASLIVGAYHTAGQRGRVSAEPWPLSQHREKVRGKDPKALLREADGAIREKNQGAACAAVQRYGELGGKSRPLFDLLLRYAVSEEGALHAEKYYHTVSDEFRTLPAPFRWRQLVALARVTASEYGRKAAGHSQACKVLKVKS